jgi:hypothetical protein
MADNRDWDKELAEIDRLMAKQGSAPPKPESTAVTRPAAPAPGGGQPPRGSANPAAPAPRVATGRRGLAVWLITLLGPIGGLALTAWPYPKGCGTMLWVYLVGVVGVVAAAIWAMQTAWQARRGLAMVIGTLTLLFGLALAAAEVLPRIGYASYALTWTCST